jgi:amidophosphoribosyltransferase
MCGIFGIFDHKDAANLTYLGLHALQHRGQESAGIASVTGAIITSHREMGHVSDIFTEDVLTKLEGRLPSGMCGTQPQVQ